VVRGYHLPVLAGVFAAQAWADTHVASAPSLILALLGLSVSAHVLSHKLLAKCAMVGILAFLPCTLLLFVVRVPGLLPVACVCWLATLCGSLGARLAPDRVSWTHISVLCIAVVLLERMGRGGFVVCALVVVAVAFVIQVWSCCRANQR
jgi:hypothetical protein